MIKLFATDLDGTFLNPYGELTDKSREVIKLAAENNALFIISSGRFYNAVDDIFSYPGQLLSDWYKEAIIKNAIPLF